MHNYDLDDIFILYLYLSSHYYYPIEFNLHCNINILLPIATHGHIPNYLKDKKHYWFENDCTMHICLISHTYRITRD
jgi:hypothetical protein